jgi:hypothetical protein
MSGTSSCANVFPALHYVFLTLSIALMQPMLHVFAQPLSNLQMPLTKVKLQRKTLSQNQLSLSNDRRTQMK